MSNLDKTVNAAQVPDAQGLIAMSRANDIRKLAISSGVDVVGIAPVERWDEFVPPGSRPYDWFYAAPLQGEMNVGELQSKRRPRPWEY